jgi:hypothetical protein
MREFQAVVRVEHKGLNLSDDEGSTELDTVTGILEPYGATAQLWQDRSEFTMTVRVPSMWDVAATAGRAVRDAFEEAGWTVAVLRVDAWDVEEWDRENSL